MAMNQEDITKLEEDARELSIRENLTPFVVPEEKSKIEFRTLEERNGASDIIKFINDLPDVDQNQKPTIINNALAYFSANQKNVNRSLSVNVKKDLYTDDNTSLSKFNIDLTQTSVDACIGNVENGINVFQNTLNITKCSINTLQEPFIRLHGSQNTIKI